MAVNSAHSEQDAEAQSPPSAERPAAGMSDRLPELPPGAFRKEDGGDDDEFYRPARLVTHIDAAATRALTAFYRATLPAGGVLLDLMSSWVSHLPPEVAFAEVTGHGMNAEELRANPLLTRSFVQNLNRTPVLPLEGESCDAALCCVGVQYLERPLDVFAEVLRVLRPGAPFLVSFSTAAYPPMRWRYGGRSTTADTPPWCVFTSSAPAFRRSAQTCCGTAPGAIR